MAYTIESLKKEIASRSANGIGTADLQAQLTNMQKTPQGTPQVNPNVGSNVVGTTNNNVSLVAPGQKLGSMIGGNITGNVGGAKDLGQNVATNTNTNANVTSTASATTTPTPKTAEQIMQEAKQAQIDASVANLKNRFNQTIADINAKKNQVTPTYDAKRLTAQSNSQLQAKNFAEFLANRGLARSGASQQAEIMRNLALQNELAGLNKQQQDDLDYYGRMADSAQSALNNDITAAETQANSNYYDNFLKYLTDKETLKKQQDFQREQSAITNALKEKEMLQNASDKEKDRQAEAIKTATTYGYNTNKLNLDQKNKTNENTMEYFKNLGYSVPQEYFTQIPEEVLAQLAPYSGNYAQAANELASTNPELAQYARIASTQKMFDNLGLLNQYGSQYMTESAKNNMNNQYWKGVEYDRNINNDVFDQNYKSNTFNADQYWKGKDYNLKEWQAQDSSARGWSSNAIAQQKANRADVSSKEKNLTDSQIYSQGNIPTGDLYKEAKSKLYNDLKNYIDSEKDIDQKYHSTPGSLERKNFFDNAIIYMNQKGIPDAQAFNILNDLGFTTKEFEYKNSGSPKEESFWSKINPFD